MGLDCSHNTWHGAYSAFMRFRHKVAELAGYEVWDVIYEGSKMSDGRGFGQPTIMLDWGHITPENLLGEWEKTPADPLVVLFAHSDCEGEIYPDQAVPLANALEELLPKMEGIDLGGHISNLKLKTEQFISGLREAAANNEPVRFR